jgi:hypothetical protein
MKRMNFPGRRARRQLKAEARQANVKMENIKQYRMNTKVIIEITK